MLRNSPLAYKLLSTVIRLYRCLHIFIYLKPIFQFPNILQFPYTLNENFQATTQNDAVILKIGTELYQFPLSVVLKIV